MTSRRPDLYGPDPGRPARASARGGCRRAGHRGREPRVTATTYRPCSARRSPPAPDSSCSPSSRSSRPTRSSRPWPARRRTSPPAWPTATPTSACCSAPTASCCASHSCTPCAQHPWATALGDRPRRGRPALGSSRPRGRRRRALPRDLPARGAPGRRRGRRALHDADRCRPRPAAPRARGREPAQRRGRQSPGCVRRGSALPALDRLHAVGARPRAVRRHHQPTGPGARPPARSRWRRCARRAPSTAS